MPHESTCQVEASPTNGELLLATLKGQTVHDFTSFLDHVMKNFSTSYPYGLSKTEVTRLTFLAWCLREAESVRKDEPVKVEG